VARTITQILGNDITLDTELPDLAFGVTLRIANITPTQRTIRVLDVTSLIPGGIVRIEGEDAASPGNPVAKPDFAIIQGVDTVNRIVTFRATPPRNNTYRMDVTQSNSPTLNPWEFRLIVTPPATTGRPAGRFDNLSLESAHPRYIFNETVLGEVQKFESNLVQIKKPPQPATAATFPDRLVDPPKPTPGSTPGPTPLKQGEEDKPADLGIAEYQKGLRNARSARPSLSPMRSLQHVPGLRYTRFSRIKVSQFQLYRPNNLTSICKESH
jgi:hypothetical protein